MKKSTRGIIKVSIITPIIILVIMYLLLAWYYKDTFSYGTWINGVYCTGKSIEEINQELIEYTCEESFDVFLPEGEIQSISLESIEYQMDYLDSLKKLKNKQNPFLWGTNIFDKDGIIIQPTCKFSNELLVKELDCFPLFQNIKQTNDYTISINKTENGYVCFNNKTSIFNFEKARDEIEKSLISGKFYVNVYDSTYFYELPITMEDLETLNLWDKIKKMQDFSTVFLFGEQEEIIDAHIVSDWIMVDENGAFVLDNKGDPIIDETKIRAYIHSLALTYNTYVYPRKYTTIDGRETTISKGNYGNLFDEEAESLYLINAYNEKIEEKHTPTYSKVALYQGINDIGPDYIEIDLTKQKMYFVSGGVLRIETDIVTGNVSNGMKTSDQICYIYSKMRNRILRGDGYASQVDFWMAINGGVGIHDAKWRKSFGGDIYKTSGSHGCINTPRDIMEEVYELSFVGMPVILYY